MRRLNDPFLHIAGTVLRDEPMSCRTTFRIGGAAAYFVEPRDEDDLRNILAVARGRRLPVYCLGAGSNVLVRDRGIRGVVIHLRGPAFCRIRVSGKVLACGAGAGLQRALNAAAAAGLGSLESLAGIPGTIGGAVVMNAGARGCSIGGALENVRVMDYNGSVSELSAEQCGFEYRGSALQRCIVLQARLRLAEVPAPAASAALRRYAALKRATQDYSAPSAGCVFRNPGGDSAGRLIDACGLKGRSVGGAVISSVHANFILNKNKARAADVMRLMAAVRRAVGKKYNIELQPEIRIW